MLPYITKLTNLGIYRDGGSLGASFESDDENQYNLLFKIDSASAAEGRQSYEAFLEKFIPTEYKSPVTGDVSPGFRHESEPITWEEARSLLEQLKPHLEGFVSEYFRVFGRMLEVAARDGK
jgi:hypothetical protein